LNHKVIKSALYFKVKLQKFIFLPFIQHSIRVWVAGPRGPAMYNLPG